MYKNVGKKTNGIVLNFIKIENIENIETRKKYSFFSLIRPISENFKK